MSVQRTLPVVARISSVVLFGYYARAGRLRQSLPQSPESGMR